MQFILGIPIELRLAILFVSGALIGSQINRGIYRLAIIEPRKIGPWSPPTNGTPPRHWFDLVPILGWFSLSREEKVHGKGFWLRPLLIEFCCGMGLMWLYFWETEQAGLCDVLPNDLLVTHVQFLAHVILISLLIMATFIDFDEQTIPDSITVPGTLIGLLFAASVPFSRLPVLTGQGPESILITSPHAWPPWLNEAWGVCFGVACILGWCLALLPWFWYARRGLKKAIQYLIAYILNPPRKTNAPDFVPPRRPDFFVLTVVVMLVVGPLYVALVWWVGGDAWTSLLTSLVGMAFSGGLIWAVRIIGKAALGREAMGFGDVTLMAMVGAFFGWQAALMIFFLAPLASVVIALGQFLFTGRTELAFGPYLSLGSVILLVNWKRMWPWMEPIFAAGWLIPTMVVACLVLMFVLLLAIRWLKTKVLGIEE